jgi:hypothetical protein
VKIWTLVVPFLYILNVSLLTGCINQPASIQKSSEEPIETSIELRQFFSGSKEIEEWPSTKIIDVLTRSDARSYYKVSAHPITTTLIVAEEIERGRKELRDAKQNKIAIDKAKAMFIKNKLCFLLYVEAVTIETALSNNFILKAGLDEKNLTELKAIETGSVPNYNEYNGPTWWWNHYYFCSNKKIDEKNGLTLYVIPKAGGERMALTWEKSVPVKSSRRR